METNRFSRTTENREQRIGSKSVRIDRRVKSTEEEERVVRLREMQKCQNLSFDNLQYFLNKGVRNNKFRK